MRVRPHLSGFLELPWAIIGAIQLCVPGFSPQTVLYSIRRKFSSPFFVLLSAPGGKAEQRGLPQGSHALQLLGGSASGEQGPGRRHEEGGE